MSPTELEATLVICSPNPEELADDIAGLKRVGSFSCRARAPQAIVDAYVDLPGGDLRAKRVGLRVRRVGAETFLTFKGPTEDRDGAKAREEVEEPWSGEALQRVCAQVEAQGILLDCTAAPSGRPPLEALREMGFVVIQERELSRRPRDVYQDQPDDILAELDIDAVRYLFGDRDILHYEVEIEVKSWGGEDAMRRLARDLRKRYAGAMRPWRFGKLATGNAVQQLLERGALAHMIDPAGRLQPEAYDRLYAWFTGE